MHKTIFCTSRVIFAIKLNQNIHPNRQAHFAAIPLKVVILKEHVLGHGMFSAVSK